MLVWLNLAICIAAIGLAGARLSRYGDVIAEKTGLGRSWVGLIMLATVTSLPELVTGISAVTIAGVPDIAVGDVLGSCVFNLAILVVVDLLHPAESIYSRASRGHILSAGFGIVMIGAVALSLQLARRGETLAIGHIGAYTPLVVALYLLAMRLPKLEFLGTGAAFFLVINWIKVPFSAQLGLLTMPSLTLNLFLLPAVAAGAWAGPMLRMSVSVSPMPGWKVLVSPWRLMATGADVEPTWRAACGASSPLRDVVMPQASPPADPGAGARRHDLPMSFVMGLATSPRVGPVTVTLRTTALTPVAGTPCWPVIWTLRVWAACHLVAVVPVPSRESSRRPGFSGVNTSPSAL